MKIRGILKVAYGQHGHREYFCNGRGTVPVNKEHLTGTVPVNKEHLTGTVPVNNNTPTLEVPLSAARKVPEFCPEVEGNPKP